MAPWGTRGVCEHTIGLRRVTERRRREPTQQPTAKRTYSARMAFATHSSARVGTRTNEMASPNDSLFGVSVQHPVPPQPSSQWQYRSLHRPWPEQPSGHATSTNLGEPSTGCVPGGCSKQSQPRESACCRSWASSVRACSRIRAASALAACTTLFGDGAARMLPAPTRASPSPAKSASPDWATWKRWARTAGPTFVECVTRRATPTTHTRNTTTASRRSRVIAHRAGVACRRASTEGCELSAGMVSTHAHARK